MYGLMRASLCGSDRERAHHRRLHYCGACKTIGRTYGQTARLLLNNDTIFLAELLTALTPGGSAPREWAGAFQSFNCCSLPTTEADAPIALQISAAATLVMSEFKIADQLDDGGGGKWRLAQRVYSQAFREASARMKAWGFPLERMWERYSEQAGREREAAHVASDRGTLQALEYVAEPTAAVTGWTFQCAAAAVGACEELARAMYALGYTFGSLVYVLDALDDFEADTRKGDFNALRAAFSLPPEQGTAAPTGSAALPEAARITVHAYLRELAEQAAAALHSLPIDAPQVRLLANRVRTNLNRRLGPETGPGGRITSRVTRLLHAIQNLIRLPAARPAFALSSGGHPPPIDNSGIPTSRSAQPRRERWRPGGCAWECCCLDCCAQIGCECACEACCESCGGCGGAGCEGCGGAGCDGCCTACDCGGCS